jgi:hypothetical protein
MSKLFAFNAAEPLETLQGSIPIDRQGSYDPVTQTWKGSDIALGAFTAVPFDTSCFTIMSALIGNDTDDVRTERDES